MKKLFFLVALYSSLAAQSIQNAQSILNTMSKVDVVADLLLKPDTLATIVDNEFNVYEILPNVKDTLRNHIDEEKYVIRGRRDELIDALERYSRFEKILKEPFIKLGLDEDYASLVLNETNFKPMLSKSYAAGPFQLITTLAKRYGARIDGYIDERYSIVISSRIAAQHIFALEQIFKDKNIVKISYILGPYGTAKAMEEALSLRKSNGFFDSYSEMVKKHNYANDFHVLNFEEFRRKFGNKDYIAYLGLVTNNDPSRRFIVSFFDYYSISPNGVYDQLVDYLKNETKNRFHSPNYPLFNEAYLDIYNEPWKYNVNFHREKPINSDEIEVYVVKENTTLDKEIEKLYGKGPMNEEKAVIYDLNWHVKHNFVPKGAKLFFLR